MRGPNSPTSACFLYYTSSSQSVTGHPIGFRRMWDKTFLSARFIIGYKIWRDHQNKILLDAENYLLFSRDTESIPPFGARVILQQPYISYSFWNEYFQELPDFLSRWKRNHKQLISNRFNTFTTFLIKIQDFIIDKLFK